MHDHDHEKGGTGLGAVAANAHASDPVREHGWDLPEGVEKGTSGKGNADYRRAEEMEPAKADEVAAERFQDMNGMQQLSKKRKKENKSNQSCL